MDSLIKNGKVVRGYLGVEISDINNPAEKALVESIRRSGFDGKGASSSASLPTGPPERAACSPVIS